VSRRQLQLRARRSGGIAVSNIGRCALRINDEPADEGTLRHADVLELTGQLVLLCVNRPPTLPAPHAPLYASGSFTFGAADPCGIVGESAAAWRLRERIAFVAARAGHVLVTGASGTGKELVARAIHAGSKRAGPCIARNAATLPESLVDAELFGNAAGYPNPGMRERPGLIGQADQGTLFLDEIGELPASLQAHLLRVLDRDGEYHRLGESRSRRSDLRLVAATNRPAGALKHDFAARMTLRLEVPGLEDRREDIPLLVAHLLDGIAREDAYLRERFFVRDDAGVRPRLEARLVAALVRHAYILHVRELEQLLWCALATSPAEHIALTDEVRADLAEHPSDAAPASDPTKANPPAHDHRVRPGDLDPAHVQAVLDKHGGVQEKAWRELGLKNRFALIRLVRKHGLLVRRS
jgi:two-component system nitrogen regulation response regulator GlnG/two-component system response regulator HydG